MSAISRSEYQKVCEENKRLKADIKKLVMNYESAPEYLETLLKYRKLFREEASFNTQMKEAAIQYINDHPEIKMQIPKPSQNLDPYSPTANWIKP